MQVLCKIFNFFLNMLSATLNVVVEAVGAVIGAAFSVLDELGSSILGSPVTLIAVGLGLWWLLASNDDEDERPKIVNGASPNAKDGIR